MGYDLCLWAASDNQINFLQEHPQYTRDFCDGQYPTMTVTETTGHWPFRKKVTKVVKADIPIIWPTAPHPEIILFGRGNLYYLLNGTNEESEALTRFPHIGYKYPGHMLGQAIQLGEAFMGYTHAFLSGQTAQLREMVYSITDEQIKQRVRDTLQEQTFDEGLEEANDDFRTLRGFLDNTCVNRNGLMWSWA